MAAGQRPPLGLPTMTQVLLLTGDIDRASPRLVGNMRLFFAMRVASSNPRSCAIQLERAILPA